MYFTFILHQLVLLSPATLMYKHAATCAGWLYLTGYAAYAMQPAVAAAAVLCIHACMHHGTQQCAVDVSTLPQAAACVAFGNATTCCPALSPCPMYSDAITMPSPMTGELTWSDSAFGDARPKPYFHWTAPVA